DVDDVAPHEDRDQPEREEHGRDGHVGSESHQAPSFASGSRSVLLRRAMYTAATSATVSTTAASSKATAYSSTARKPTPMRSAEPKPLCARPSSGAPRTNQVAEPATLSARNSV